MGRAIVMDRDEFLKRHSELIEHYQYIEFELEGILSAIDEEKTFLEGMEEVEKDNISRLINKILAKQKLIHKTVLSIDECDQLKQICIRRNYWCHDCFIKMTFDYRTEAPTNKREVDELIKDTMEAEQMRSHLHEKKLVLMS